jgi:hypothetical protein
MVFMKRPATRTTNFRHPVDAGRAERFQRPLTPHNFRNSTMLRQDQDLLNERPSALVFAVASLAVKQYRKGGTSECGVEEIFRYFEMLDSR